MMNEEDKEFTTIEEITSHIGGINEYNILRDWVANSCPEEELENWNKAINPDSSALIIKTYLARLAHKYDSSHGLEKRDIDDEVIDNILKEKRYIAAIINEEDPYFENAMGQKGSINNFAYTIGNCTQDPPVPELLTFFPYEGTILLALNVLSECLINGTIKSIKDNEAIEIFGIIGAGGKIPIRIRMIDKEEIKEVHERFTTQVPSNQPIILVDIPDVNGYFPDDKEFIENENNKTYLKNIPKWIKTSYSDKTISSLVIDLEKTIEEAFNKKNKDSENEKNIKHLPIPLWVKGILVIGFCLFTFESLSFKTTLNDAVLKTRAERAYYSKDYLSAINMFEELIIRYPEEKYLIKNLGYSYYKQGLYKEALLIFSMLEGKEFSEKEIKLIEARINDSLLKLGLNYKGEKI